MPIATITSLFLDIGIPAYAFPYLLRGNRALIYYLHALLYHLYQEDEALVEIVDEADDIAPRIHPAIVATNNVVRDLHHRTPGRREEERRGKRDVKLLIQALSTPHRNYGYAEAWRASYPPEMGDRSPTNILIYFAIAYLNLVCGVWASPTGTAVPYHSLLTIINRDAPRIYYGLKAHPHLRQLLLDANITSHYEFRGLLSKKSVLWNNAINQAVSIWGPLGNDTKQVRSLFTTDLMRLAMVMNWSVGGHRDYSACVMFAKKGARALVLLFATGWQVFNEPGTNNWRVTVHDVKIYSHHALREVTFWYRGYDGYRFGIFYRRRHSIEIKSTAGRETLFGYGTTAHFHKQMQQHMINAGYPANFASCHSWRVGHFNEAIIMSRSGKCFLYFALRIFVCFMFSVSVLTCYFDWCFLIVSMFFYQVMVPLR